MNGLRFSQLSPRDRRILMAALPVIAVLLALVALRMQPLQDDDPQQRLNRALEDMAWLNTQRARITPQRCTGGDSLEAIASRHAVPLVLVADSEGGQRWKLENVAGNHAVELVKTLECAGYRLRQLEWNTLDDRGTVNGYLILEAL